MILDLSEYKIQIVGSAQGEEVDFRELMRFNFKKEAQAYAKTQGFRTQDVQQCQTRFALFWIVYCYHHNRAIATNGRIATLTKKEKPLMTGEDFRKLRESSNCKITELSTKFSIPPFVINRWERGKAKLEPQKVNAMVRHFDGTID